MKWFSILLAIFLCSPVFAEDKQGNTFGGVPPPDTVGQILGTDGTLPEWETVAGGTGNCHFTRNGPGSYTLNCPNYMTNLMGAPPQFIGFSAAGVSENETMSGDATMARTAAGTYKITVTKLNGIVPGGACPANQFVNLINASAVPTCAPIPSNFAPLVNPPGGQNNYAPIDSPTFTGTVRFPDNSYFNSSGSTFDQKVHAGGGLEVSFGLTSDNWMSVNGPATFGSTVATGPLTVHSTTNPGITIQADDGRAIVTSQNINAGSYSINGTDIKTLFSGVGACTGGQVVSALNANAPPTCVVGGGGGGFTAGGDLSGTSTTQKVIGLQGVALPVPTNGYLWSNGTALSWVASSGMPFAPLMNPTGGQNNYAPIASPTFTGTINIPNISSSSVLLGATNFPTGSLLGFQGTDFDMAATAYYSGSSWVAAATSAGIFSINGTSGFTFFQNTGLTAGNNYSPTVIATVTKTGINLPTGSNFTVNGVPIGGGGISEAPQDGNAYFRSNAAWESGGLVANDMIVPAVHLTNLSGWAPLNFGNPNVAAGTSGAIVASLFGYNGGSGGNNNLNITAGAHMWNGNWQADTATAESIVMNPTTVSFQYSTGNTVGQVLGTWTTMATVSNAGINLPTGELFTIAGSVPYAPKTNFTGGGNNYAPIANAVFTGTTQFADSSIINNSSNNGVAGYVYGFNSSTGVAIGTARTGSTSIGGNMLIAGQKITPAILLEATGWSPDGSIVYTTGTTGALSIAHKATTDGTNWTAWGNDAEIITFGPGPSTAINFYSNGGLTAGVNYTPTQIASWNNTGLNLITGSLLLNGKNQFSTGTWTPLMNCGGGTPASDSSGSGQYVTVGNMVWFSGHLGWSTATNGAGQGYVTNLPFNAIDVAGNGILISDVLIDNATSPSFGNTGRMVATIWNGQNYLKFYETNFGTAGYLYPLACSGLWSNSPSNARFNGWYRFQ